jgi:hypothetical protein
MSSTSRTFTLFPQLLPEIRLLIWEHALQPRIITFTCTLYSFNVRNAPQALYLVGGDAPYSHFTMDVPQRPTSPYYIVQCYPDDVASPPLLGTCHESREVALRHGYKPWLIENESLGTREVVWNPELDVISLAMAEKSLQVDELCVDVFVSLFPEQTREVRRLVVESEHHHRRTVEHACEWARILDFHNLVELVGLVGITRNTQRAAAAVRNCLELAKEQRLARLKTGCEEYQRLDRWFPERIRAMGDEDDFLCEESGVYRWH